MEDDEEDKISPMKEDRNVGSLRVPRKNQTDNLQEIMRTTFTSMNKV